MPPVPPAPLLVFRLYADNTPWRLPREADLRLRLVNVPVARGPGQAGLPFSFAALPGRYLADLVDMACRESWKGPKAILSPALNHPPALLAALLAETADLGFGAAGPAGTDWLILHDYNEQVVGYVMAPGWRPSPELLLELRYLSGRDALTDAELLRALGVRCQVRKVRGPHDQAISEALPLFHGMGSIAVQSARARLAMLRAGRRQTLAIITHHAGDVLLAVQAIEACGQGLDGIVVHRAYADVARSVAGWLPIIEVDGPLPARGDISSPAHPLNDEILYFEQVVAPTLPADASFLFLRPSRGYIDAEYTLAAQIAYTVGHRGDEARYPQGFSLVEPDTALLLEHREQLPRVKGRRVLLHFDGGWPLKIYPADWQLQLIDALLEAGFQPSVLGPSLQSVPAHRFTSLAALETLMREHDLLIGMDSFPCHYASQSLGLPTICLYASTRMENLAHAAPDYLAMDQGLVCSPCGSREICPRFGGTACHNFVPPDQVAELAQLCLQEP